MFRIYGTKQKPLGWEQEAMFGDAQTALNLQIKSNFPNFNKKKIVAFSRKVISQTTALAFGNDEFINNVVKESYTDIMKSKELSKFVTRTSEKKDDGSVDLKRLKEVEPNQMRVLSTSGILKDAVDLVLRVAEINMELFTGEMMGNADLFTSTGADKVFLSKLSKQGINPADLEGFISLLELNNLPDIGLAVSSGNLPLQKYWTQRNSKLAEKFRKWLQNAKPQDARDLEKAYIEAIGKYSKIESLPMKSLRLAITGAAGIYFSILGGLVIDAADSFFVEKWLGGYSPKLFFDELQKLKIGE